MDYSLRIIVIPAAFIDVKVCMAVGYSFTQKLLNGFRLNLAHGWLIARINIYDIFFMRIFPRDRNL